MDAVEFLKEKNRMMRTDSEAYNEIKDIPTVQAVVAYVEDWSHKHPRKTRMQDFLEKYPNAALKPDGLKTPTVCASELGYCKHCTHSIYCNPDCYSCWNEPVED